MTPVRHVTGVCKCERTFLQEEKSGYLDEEVNDAC